MASLIRPLFLPLRPDALLDRVLGEGFTFGLANRLVHPLVMAFKKPITLAVLDEAREVLMAGRYAQDLSRALAENDAQLREMVLKGIEDDEAIGVLRHLPFHEPLIEGGTALILRVIRHVLDADATDETVADFVRYTMEQLEQAVAAKQEEIIRCGHVRGSYDPPLLPAEPATPTDSVEMQTYDG